MIYLIFLGLTFFIQLLAASWYDLASKTRGKKDVFKYKMLCSLVYIADFLLCSAINKPYREIYFIILAVSFILFFITDIIEDNPFKNAQIIAQHIRATSQILLGVSFFTRAFTDFPHLIHKKTPFIIIGVIIAVIAFIILILPKTAFNKKEKLISLLPLITGALVLGITLQKTQDPKMQASSCALILGTFALSVKTVYEISSLPQKNTLVPINAYYFGLMFTACSIL